MKKYKVELEIHLPEKKKAKAIKLARKLCGDSWDNDGHKLTPQEQIEDDQDAVFELVNSNPLLKKLKIYIEASQIKEILDKLPIPEPKSRSCNRKGRPVNTNRNGLISTMN